MIDVKNNHKKYIVFFIFCIFLSTNLFALPPLNVDKTSDMWNNNWDLPIVESLIAFGSSLYNFMDTARKFCVFFFFLNLVWHSFKLWFGAIEIKKVAIDIVFKYLLVTTLMTIYPALVDGVFSIASNIGIGNTGSAAYLTDEITTTFTASYNATLTSVKAIKLALGEKGGLKNIKPSDMKSLSTALGMTQEELEQQFKQVYPDYKTSNVKFDWNTFKRGFSVGNALSGGNMVTGGLSGLAFGLLDKSNRKKRYEEIFKNSVSRYDIENMVILFETFNSSFGVKDITADTVAAILNGSTSPEELDAAMQLGESEIKDNIRAYFTSPFMDIPYTTTEHTIDTEANILKSGTKKVSHTFRTNLLSPSQMLRIGVMLAKVVDNKSKISVDKHQNKSGEEEGTTGSSVILNFTNMTIGRLFETIIKFILPWLMLIPVIICIVNYVVCMLEYYLVTSVGILFVPMLLFDPLKQYGSKLLNLFFSYFLKVMFISIINYFCLAFLLQSGTYLMLSPDTFGFQSVGYALFVFILCLVLSQSAPEIGQVLLSGNPSVNAGTVARAGHQMAHAYRMGSNAARRVAHTGAAVAKGTAGAAVGGALAGKTLMQNRAAVAEQGNQLFNSLRDNINPATGSKYTETEAKQAQKEFQRDTNRQMLKEDIGQRVKSKFGFTSNTDREHPKESVGGIGQKDVFGNKISSSMNNEAARERAKKAHQAYLGKNDLVDKKLEGPDKSSNT